MTTKFLTLDELVRRVPSVGTAMPHPDVSEKYQHISTLRIAEMLSKMGWGPVRAREQFVQTNNRGFQKHEVAFRQSSIVNNHKFQFLPEQHRIEMDNAEEVFELVIHNSHNRTSVWELLGGIFVKVCANGLIISRNTFSEIRVRHVGITMGEVLANVNLAANRMNDVMLLKDEMKVVDMNDTQRMDFAERALLLRYESLESAAVGPRVLLESRRKEDAGTNLWKTYQVVQENLIRGLQRDAAKRDIVGRQFSPSAPITSIDRGTRINQDLWDMACEFMNN